MDKLIILYFINAMRRLIKCKMFIKKDQARYVNNSILMVKSN